MSKEEIEKTEERPAFKLFIRRVGCKSFQEYMDLFREDWEKRETACKWFFEFYPNQAIN
jgi:hypothetical protein